ncbi:MAG: NTP transferase domain-containing protein [Planctomycetota bacterium]
MDRLVYAALLAAGSSRRMGSAKALLKFGERTALERAVASIRAAGIINITIVTGIDEAAASHACSLSVQLGNIQIVENADPDAGRTRSLQLALASIPADAAVLLFPVDCPNVAPQTIVTMMDQRVRAEIVRPRYNGKCGHPVLFEASLRREILELQPDEPLRAVVHRDPKRLTDVDVTDPEVLTNLDTPQDYQNALARFAKHL